VSGPSIEHLETADGDSPDAEIRILFGGPRPANMMMFLRADIVLDSGFETELGADAAVFDHLHWETPSWVQSRSKHQME
jgi:hypothetical protein